MKKVAIVLSLSTVVMLIIACGGKMVNRGYLSASNPDELPIYLITLGNFRETPACSTTPSSSCVMNETTNMPLGKIQDVLRQALQYYQENCSRK
ncbi:hypothetical protein SAMN05660461_0801 [Chitinophaga ginsengisegetis]|uniref:Lipoprotein n=1 Tax=Chitinophaga ginsengisegetis TaxID=393003 RepID=A0A1T5N9L7_9BACT|nr:hypothetical protein [Chitinophaga ginsengisegetis]SKC96963.1 hypothetical protein SAMN05660461_0801 [Chitinophaga ginsengisegetis]